MNRIRLANDLLRLTVALKGGAVEAFAADTADGLVPIFFRGADSRLPVCFPFVPFGNRLRGNSFTFESRDYRLPANTSDDPLYLHGDGWLEDWTLESASDAQAVLALDHTGSDRPYSYRAWQSFSLDERTLRITLSATNTGQFCMPFGLGLHPFLPLTAHTELEFRAEGYWEQDEAFLPTRRRPVSGPFDFSRARSLARRWMNTEFEGWSGHTLIRWPETGAALRIGTEPALNRCMLFMSDRSFDPGYAGDWFCFEPMTHGVDAHHRDDGGLVPLNPGETITMRTSFEYRPGP